MNNKCMGEGLLKTLYLLCKHSQKRKANTIF